MAYPPITSLGTVPQRTQTPAEFATNADSFLGALPNFRTELNAFGAYVDAAGASIDSTIGAAVAGATAASAASAAAASGSASAAATSASAASGSATASASSAASALAYKDLAASNANFKGLWSSLTGALNVPAMVYHSGLYWNLTANLANVTTAQPGVSGSWIVANGDSFRRTVDNLFARATLDLNFANNSHKVYEQFGLEPKQLQSAVLTTRNSTATYQSPTGIATAAINTPRITYDAVTGEALGLLAEEMRTNLSWPSNDFTGVTWIKENSSTITPETINSPLGTLTGSAHVSAGTAALTLRQTITAVAGTYCVSVFLKAGELSSIAVQINDNGTISNRVSARINLLTGELSNLEPSVGTFSGGLFAVEAHPSGWYRVSVSGTATSLSGTGYQIRFITIGTVSLGQKYYVAGAQFEAGLAPSSYIPTTTAQVTRVADVISRALTTTNANAGALYAEVKVMSALPNLFWTEVLRLADSAPTAIRGVGLQFDNDLIRMVVRDSAGTATGIPSLAANPNELNKILCSFDYTTNTALIAINGVSNVVSLGASGSLSGFTSNLFIGYSGNVAGGNAAASSQQIKRCTYFPRSFTAAEAQAITA